MMMSRTVAHMMHLKTGSLSEHEALEDFYTSIVDHMDTLAETAQGKFGKLNIPFKKMEGDVNKPAATLEKHLMEIKRLAEGCDSRVLDAIVDNVEMCFSKTLYKLKELA